MLTIDLLFRFLLVEIILRVADLFDDHNNGQLKYIINQLKYTFILIWLLIRLQNL